MTKNELIKNIFNKNLDNESISDIIMNHCGKYIEKNSQQYVSSAYSAFKKINIKLSYDYAEIKDMEYPELLEVSYNDGGYVVKAG